MKPPKVVKQILSDINKTINELSEKGIVRDYKGVSSKQISNSKWDISFSDKNEENNIMYDKHITCDKIMDILLKELQYTVLLYDKGLVQAEFIIENNKVIKERLIFIKKHNKVWNIEEINECDNNDEDWFSEDGIPIMLRIDFVPNDHKEVEHASCHLTISNHENCRVPIRGLVTFSEFIRFVLVHFYNIKLDLTPLKSQTITITDLEKKMMYINWK